MLMMKAGVFRPKRLVSLRKLARLSGIAATGEGDLAIGALTPLSDVERSAAVASRAPVIVRAMRRLSNVRVRNVATIGGNLAHGDPHMDLPPVLMALDASVVVKGRGGERTLKVENLFAGYYETVLKRDDIIAELRIPPQGARRAAYLKCTTGSADDWPALGVAISLEADSNVMRAPRVVVSAATEKAIRLKGAEKVLSGATIDDGVLARAGDAAAEEAETVSDVRGSAAYKRELIRVYVSRAVRQAFDGAASDGAGGRR
jgi:carbon-monoxide dehydrogenase medium subunit